MSRNDAILLTAVLVNVLIVLFFLGSGFNVLGTQQVLDRLATPWLRMTLWQRVMVVILLVSGSEALLALNQLVQREPVDWRASALRLTFATLIGIVVLALLLPTVARRTR